MDSAPSDPCLRHVPARLETARLVLRAHQKGDGPLLHEAMAESIDALRRHLWSLSWVAVEPTPETAEIRSRHCAAAFLRRDELVWLVFEKPALGGRLVGSVGLHHLDWALPRAEIGFWGRSSTAGRGHVSEAVRAVMDWALAGAPQGMGAQRVTLVADERNVASRRVAERCGFLLEGTLRNMQRAPDGSLRHHCVYARYPAS